ncbi:BT1926 family outer membrane beta-barrel protein [Capnocytophaga canis]|uniref:BT1926 family outer membrane beta-barrel protein n=1 Tax=Capnocytophaga canis TaxID=1848903 RepID=UPI001AD4E0D2|nr:BT1926 family outer membrane beta-barrel protein [Capnocytophaga canis]GIM60985.1 hypothetical protein CAPN008_10350 [Capnocytophaga canis]
MKIKKILLIAFTVPTLWITANAQEEQASKSNKFTFAATLGYNSYEIASAPYGLGKSFSPVQHMTSWTTKGSMVGFEAGWFLNDDWRFVGSFGLSYSAYPGYYEVPGVNTEDVFIPRYETIPVQHDLSYAMSLGGDRYFNIEGTKLSWFAGGRMGLAYAQNSNRYNYAEHIEFGSSVARTWNYRIAAVAGADYYFSDRFFVGAQIEGISYTYAVSSIKPQPGLANRSADHYNLSFFGAPTIKIGFVLF